jgi:hypothetical protein
MIKCDWLAESLKSALKCDWLKEGAISARIALLGVRFVLKSHSCEQIRLQETPLISK